MTPSISSVRSRGSAHVLIPAAVALVALIATAIGVSEPSMAPPPPPPGPGDTVVIHGPRTYNAPIGSPNTIQNFVDTIPVVMHAYNRYVVRVKNGNTDGTQRVLRAVVGTDSITGSIAIKTFEIAAKPTTTVNVSIRGQATAGHLTVELLEIYGGNFAIFGAEQFSRTNTNSDVVFTRTFTRGANAGPPFHLWIVNGNSNGSQRLSGVIVKLNADTVVGPPPKPTLTTSTAMLQVQVSPVSGSNTLVITLPKKQSGFINLAVMATDITRPTLTVTAPAQNFITRFDTVVARGTVTDQSPVRVTVNGALATITGNNFSRVVTLPEGHVVLTFSAVDAAGNRTDTTRNGISDRTSPVWEVLAPPPNGFITNQTSIAISGTASDNLTGVTVYVDDSVVQAPSGTFSVTMPLVEGLNTFGVSALDGAGNGGNIAQLLMGTRDTQRPTLTVSAPANGATVSTPTVTVQGTASDAMLKDVKVNGVATTVTNGAFSKVVDLAVGQNTIVVIATDSATNADTVTRTVTRTGGLPPDPATVATAIDPTVPTTIATSTAFLYSGSNPIQTGVAPGTIEPVLAAVVRGKVLTGDGQPLPGVTVTVLGHPEFGQTLSRADGGYDLALNGGGQLTLSYTLNGYIGAQRQSTVPWQDFVVMDDVRLLARDPAVTAIAFTQPIEVARGSAVSDARGARRTTMLFAQGTTATMVRSDNSTQVLPNLHVRATEFTVGPKGPEAMPAPLPPTSAYTWAADLNADEAVAANAKAILFDKPVVVYLENFLDFPVGLPVPLGIYDQEKAAWNPIPNGRVIQIVDAPGGVARIALDGSGQPASDAALTAMGITTAERTSLASLYASGQELWRMTTTHFSWIDGNWPWGPDTTRQGPDQSQAGGAGSQGDPCEQTGSIIECENQVLGERVPLVGSSSALNYRSVGVPGHIAPRQMTVPLTDSVLPAGLRQVFLDIELAGRRFHYEFTVAAGTLTTNLKQTFRWDGKDAYDRTVNGAQPTHVTIAYRYPGLYAIPADEAASFGLTCFGPIENPSFLQCQLPALPNPDMFLTDKKQEYVVALGELTPNNIGGWTLDRMHSYDPYVRTLYLGNGVRQTAGSVNSVIQTVAGNGTSGGGGDGGPATAASVSPDAVAVAADGTILIADQQNNRVRGIALDGTIRTVVGNGSGAYSGDGGPALSAGIDPSDIKVGPDGSLYVADNVNHRVRRVGTNGIISTVAGSPTPNCDGLGAGDGGPATAAGLCFPYSIAVGPDGSFYIAEAWRVRRVDPTGIITTVAGIDRFCNTSNPDDGPHCGDGRMAVRAPLNFVESIDVDRAGNLYIADDFGNVIRRVSKEGVITTVAGNWSASGFAGDGGPAVQATLDKLEGIAIANDGGFYFSDRGRIRRVTPNGIIYTTAGGANTAFAGDGGPALQAQINAPFGIRLTVGPDGAYYLAERFSLRVRRVAPAFPGFTDTDNAIASSGGGELYQFDSAGRHVRTLDALSGAVVDSFVYNPAGRLLRIVSRNNDTITVERDGSGAPTAIVAPFGQRTTVSLSPDGYLGTITGPAGQHFQSTYLTGGLLATLTDPRDYQSAFAYDTLGRLVSDSDAVGSVVHLANLRSDSVTEVTFTSALGRTTTYRVERTALGTTRQVTSPTGPGPTMKSDSGGSMTVVVPAGDSTSIVLDGDPRWGMQVPIPDSLRLKLPSGLTVMSRSRSRVVIADPTNPFSLVSQTDSTSLNDNWKVTTFTVATRRFVQTTPENRQYRAALDGQGRVISAGIAGIDSVVLTYDDRGRLTQQQSGGRIWTMTYDTRGRLQSMIDPVGRWDSLFYDDANRLTRQLRPGGRSVQFAYDLTGNVTSITPPSRPAHGFQYSPVSLNFQYDPPGIPGPKPTRFFYNLDRQLDSIVRPDSTAIKVSRDANGRTSRVTYNGGDLIFTYLSSTGQLASVRTLSGDQLEFTYDGSVPTEMQWSGAVNGSVGIRYNNDFRVAAQAVNGTDSIMFEYDRDGMITRAGDLVLGRDPVNGLLVADTLGGVRSSYRYNAHGESDGSRTVTDLGSLYATGFVRDGSGRITQRFDTVQGVPTRWSFVYDSVGQLVEDSINGAINHAFTYDNNGNRLSYTSSNGTVNYGYDNQDRLQSAGSNTYAFGSNGELKTKTVSGVGTTTYTYDGLGNLITVLQPTGTRIDYVVDGDNRRVGQKINGSLVRAWLYQNQLKPTAELDATGNVISRFVYATDGNVPDYMVRGGTTYRLISDYLGSVRLVVNATNGAVAQRIDYDEWGNVTFDNNPGFQPFGFAGGLYDANTKLVRFGARDYDPSIGRWTAHDPVLFAAASANLYSYVDNDPVNFIDPTGLETESPGFWEGLIPIWGSGKQALHDFECGNILGGLLNTGLAISDVFLLKSLATGLTKGLLRLGGSFEWGAVRKWLGKIGFAEPGQHVHHWLIPQKGWGSFVPNWLKNQPWNLMPMPSQAFHLGLHGAGEMGLLERLFFGSPAWAKLLGLDAAGKLANAARPDCGC